MNAEPTPRSEGAGMRGGGVVAWPRPCWRCRNSPGDAFSRVGAVVRLISRISEELLGKSAAMGQWGLGDGNALQQCKDESYYIVLQKLVASLVIYPGLIVELYRNLKPAKPIALQQLWRLHPGCVPTPGTGTIQIRRTRRSRSAPSKILSVTSKRSKSSGTGWEMPTRTRTPRGTTREPVVITSSSYDFLGPISGRPVLSRHSTVPELDISQLFTPTLPPVKDEPVSALVPPFTPPRSASQLAALRKVGRDAPLKPRPTFSTSLPEGSQAPGLRLAYWSSSSSLSDKKTPEPEEKPVSTMPGEDENRSASQAYFQAMPLRNERRAPKFDGHGAYLSQFFRDFETVALAAGLEDRQWIVRVMDYAPAVDYKLWKSVGNQPAMDSDKHGSTPGAKQSTLTQPRAAPDPCAGLGLGLRRVHGSRHSNRSSSKHSGQT
ncbi:hypothetical protein DFP72DRAFT_1048537 [Ephemerocybe angulata]|uniref:Uncharacterized protein n=1 Tax=Ephemerocybe angulata TaxID=980116 RepID=A0A8H6HN17_9AGAR|nr:hypothetical protein DFP72DRAFT_1048537 [Tulosesus angulatus]